MQPLSSLPGELSLVALWLPVACGKSIDKRFTDFTGLRYFKESEKRSCSEMFALFKKVVTENWVEDDPFLQK